eukprot:CAMPEP_0119106308 /NCGR_PEP_ID=MMETSP1180-20130426/4035_1 /TAXON_ID=3052 ORGANISM="Chlamydomonas cf sp, Strain CCMP681" /NCGR_SAMPLE_ID=MMETSP1180 /ASSEMBLY_ACC=CAM_ASM_000741 /LENGTH=110 /DNA_ID=CAMNT_0007091619 /DNA_START=40 /DNA_END=372 /DNA_ORIENTATION=+
MQSTISRSTAGVSPSLAKSRSVTCQPRPVSSRVAVVVHARNAGPLPGQDQDIESGNWIQNVFKYLQAATARALGHKLSPSEPDWPEGGYTGKSSKDRSRKRQDGFHSTKR